jgi:hypothetical protein
MTVAIRTRGSGTLRLTLLVLAVGGFLGWCRESELRDDPLLAATQSAEGWALLAAIGVVLGSGARRSRAQALDPWLFRSIALVGAILLLKALRDRATVIYEKPRWKVDSIERLLKAWDGTIAGWSFVSESWRTHWFRPPLAILLGIGLAVLFLSAGFALARWFSLTRLWLFHAGTTELVPGTDEPVAIR